MYDGGWRQNKIIWNISFNTLGMQPCPKTLLNWVKFDFTISTFFQKPAFFPILAKKNYHPINEEKATKGTNTLPYKPKKLDSYSHICKVSWGIVSFKNLKIISSPAQTTVQLPAPL